MSPPVSYIRDSASASKPAAGCDLTVIAQPRARRTEFAGTHDGVLRVRLQAPPVDGKANEELIGFLAQALGVPKSAVTLRRGAASRRKVVAVRGRTAAAAAQRLQQSRRTSAVQTGE